jgi:hypothetical protein
MCRDQNRGRKAHVIRRVALGGWGQRLLELHAVAFAGTSQRCHHNHECKSESEKANNAFGHSLAALNSAGASSPVPLKRMTPRVGSFHRSPETQVHAWFIRAIS